MSSSSISRPSSFLTNFSTFILNVSSTLFSNEIINIIKESFLAKKQISTLYF